MARTLLSGLMSAVFGMSAVAGAGAQTLFIGVGPAGSVMQVGPSGTSSLVYSDPGDQFSVTATDFSNGADLGSTNTTISVLGTPGTTLSIWVTETGINLGPTPQKLLIQSALTQNQLPAGATVTETTYFDATDKPFGTGTLLATHTFNAIGTATPVSTVLNAMVPYSISEEYDIQFTLPAPPTALSTISMQTTPEGPIPIVPEPSTWIMMALGFAGLGFAAYGRGRRSLA